MLALLRLKKKDLYSDKYLDITCHHSWYPSLSIRGIRQVNKKSVDIYMDQIDSVRYDIAHDPTSRRIITNIYNLQDLIDFDLCSGKANNFSRSFKEKIEWVRNFYNMNSFDKNAVKKQRKK